MPTPLQILNKRRQHLKNKKLEQSNAINSTNDSSPQAEVSKGKSSSNSETLSIQSQLADDSIWTSTIYHRSPVTNISPQESRRMEQDYGEKMLHFHSATFSNSLLYLNPSFFPDILEGDIIYISTDKNKKPQIFLEAELSSVQATIPISIQDKIGRILKLTPQQIVRIGTCSRETTALDKVDVNIVDGCLPRHEMWYLLHSLQNHFVTVNQRIAYGRCEVEIRTMSRKSCPVYGGLITSSTNVNFNRNCSRIYVVIHITRELVATDNSGYLRGEILTDFCLKKLFDIWKEEKTNHLITMLLYMDVDCVHQGKVFTIQQPYIRVLCKDKCNDFEGVISDVKRFISSIRNDFILEYAFPSIAITDADQFMLSRSEFSTPLVVLNTIIKDVKYNKRTSHFSVNGSHIIYLTSSVPIYRCKESLYTITHNNLREAAVGVDLISVAPLPPFPAPLFIFMNTRPTQSATSGCMPTAFYSIISDDFLQPLSMNEKQQDALSSQSRLSSFFSHSRFHRRVFHDMPPILPQLPIVTRKERGDNLQDILSCDEITSSLNDGQLNGEPHSIEDGTYLRTKVASNFSSADSAYETEKRLYERNSTDMSANSQSFKDPYLLPFSSNAGVTSNPMSYTDLTSYAQEPLTGREISDEEGVVNTEVPANDDILFWRGRTDRKFSAQFRKSMATPTILPLILPDHLHLPSAGDENTQNYTVMMNTREDRILCDSILLRLAFNFQFEDSIPNWNDVESVTLSLRRKERHIISKALTKLVSFEIQTRSNNTEKEMNHEICISFPNDNVIHTKTINLNQPVIQWNAIDNSLNPSEYDYTKVTAMSHYSRLHFVIAEKGKKEYKLDYLFQSLIMCYPSLQMMVHDIHRNNTPATKKLVQVHIGEEVLIIAYDTCIMQPVLFHFDIFWTVASLHTIRSFIDDVRRITTKSGLLLHQYPDEIVSSLEKPASPFCFYDSFTIIPGATPYLEMILNKTWTLITNDEIICYADDHTSNYLQLDKDKGKCYLYNNKKEWDINTRTQVQEFVEIASIIDDCMGSL